MKRNIVIVIALYGLLPLGSCDKEKEEEAGALFSQLTSELTGVDFRNDLKYDREFNIYTYRNFYNGGGAAIGDINNDGLPDIYFTGNQVKNQLYLNKGNFTFENITLKAGVAGSRAWSTGVSMADVNGDRLLDIYVCNSGDVKGDNKQNELFINNGDLTFTEKAEEFGLDDRGYSTHAAFFDFDKDGDLDVYLLNNSYQAIGSFNLMQNVRSQRDSVGGDKLFLNDNGYYRDISEKAGIYGSIIGFGLGVTIGDVNADGWEDIFVSNDFFERDYLYINNTDGTFTEVLKESMPSISAASMGADIGDINNDGRPDIFVTDMLPENLDRLKQVTTFENWDKLHYNVKNDYHYQYNRNMLHLNNGDGTFSEIGRLAGVSATDWSWGALFFDADNDGLKDIFVANGIYHDITDLDYLNFISHEEVMKKVISKEGVNYKELIDPIPVTPISNYAFKNNGNLSFENKAAYWGLDTPGHSNGAAYGDLDNDGDLDFVVNNVNDEVFIYKNNAEVVLEHNYLQLELKGSGKNTFGIGSKIRVKAGNDLYYYEQMPIRGFQSSMDPVITIGVGTNDTIEELEVMWPDFSKSLIKNLKANQRLVVEHTAAEANFIHRVHREMRDNKLFYQIEGVVDFTHKENDFVDFDRDRLTYHMISREGPALAKGDVNGDGLEDIFIGGAKGQAGKIMLQENGKLVSFHSEAFEADRGSEDVNAAFFDADGDGDLDLVVLSGGNEFTFGSPELINRIYFNNGKGKFTRSEQKAMNQFRNISSVVKVQDIDNDGDLDLFIANRLRPFLYGVPADCYLLLNDGNGNFSNASEELAPELKEIGMVTDAVFIDFDGDNDNDLVIVGEWMKPEIFENNGGKFSKINRIAGFDGLYGWWNSIKAADLDNDGDQDLVLGNHGLNSKFKTSEESPLYLYINDFDQNGSAEHIFCTTIDGKITPYTLKHDLVAQIPGLKKKYLKYNNYNNQSIEQIFSTGQLNSAIVLKANILRSVALMNNKGQYTVKELPVQAQFSPVYSIEAQDFDGDGHLDLIFGGNLTGAKPEAGKYDASYGLLLKGIGNGEFNAIGSKDSGICIKGDIRELLTFDLSGKPAVLVAINNDRIKVLGFDEK
jgi:hypothetical protein